MVEGLFDGNHTFKYLTTELGSHTAGSRQYVIRGG